MSAPIPLLIVGAGGRMGRAILEAAGLDPGVRVEAALVRRPVEGGLPGSPRCFSDLEEASLAAPGSVAIDLSSPRGAEARIRALAERGHPLVEGTTGLGEEARSALRAAGAVTAVVAAPNLSLGVALLRRALRVLLPGVPAGWAITIEERHHRGKKDAPSGTALLLAREVEERLPPGAPLVPIASLREGDVVGEHTVRISSPDEELTLAHRALSRRLFARGALAAARFAAASPPGLYGVDDVLG